MLSFSCRKQSPWWAGAVFGFSFLVCGTIVQAQVPFVDDRESPVASLAFVSTVLAEQRSGPDSFLETYEDWTVGCARSPEDPENPDLENESDRNCTMQQSVSWRNEDGTVIDHFLIVTVLPAQEDEKFQITILTPFGLSLPKGLELQVDQLEPFQVEFQTCRQRGCFAQKTLDDETMRKLKTGQVIQASMFESRTDTPFNVEVSLKGFMLASDRLKGIVQQQ